MVVLLKTNSGKFGYLHFVLNALMKFLNCVTATFILSRWKFSVIGWLYWDRCKRYRACSSRIKCIFCNVSRFHYSCTHTTTFGDNQSFVLHDKCLKMDTPGVRTFQTKYWLWPKIVLLSVLCNMPTPKMLWWLPGPVKSVCYAQ